MSAIPTRAAPGWGRRKSWWVTASGVRHGPDEAAIAGALSARERFILATNDLDTAGYPDARLLHDYKDQQGVERGFRFLKDPWFMVDSIFLKSPKRIEAFMMVMTLCLLVYHVAQYRLRQRLKDEHETLPSQLSKPVQNPTLRWLLQLMEGISLVRLSGELTQGVLMVVVTNLTGVRKKIIRLFGDTACRLYGLMPT